jgi:hypothetical protein
MLAFLKTRSLTFTKNTNYRNLILLVLLNVVLLFQAQAQLPACTTPTRTYWLSASLNPVCPMKNGSLSITIPGTVSGAYKVTLMYRPLGTNVPLQPYSGAQSIESTKAGGTTVTYTFNNLDPNYYCVLVQTMQGCFNTDVELTCCVPTKIQWMEAIKLPLCNLNNGSLTLRLGQGVVYGKYRVTLMYRKLGTNDPLMPYPGAMPVSGDRLQTDPTSFVTFNNLAPNYYCTIIQTYYGCFNVDNELNCDNSPVCTYTQGAWGSVGGKMSDGTTATKWATKDLISMSIARWGGTLRIGDQTPGGRALLITTAQQVIDALPDGGPSIVLTHTGGLALSDFSTKYSGKMGSLIAQTIALGLNLKIGDQYLADIPLTGIVDAAVIDKLTDKTVGGLYALANKVLYMGEAAGNGLTLSQIADAEDAVNNFFDECKIYQGPGVAARYVTTTTEVAEVKAATETRSTAAIQVAASPNPFRNNVRFVVESATSGQGVLEVYNTSGVKLATPFRGYVSAGKGQVIEYKTSSLLNSSLLYIFRVNGRQVSGKLIAAK